MILNTIILTFFVYLIVNSILKEKIGSEVSQKIGLLAGLFISIGSTNFNFYSVHLVPFVFAFNYILITVYLLLNLDRLKIFYAQIIIIIELCTLILCHPFPTLLMEFILFINVVLLVVSNKLNIPQFRDDLKQKFFIYFLVLFTIGMIIYWLDFTNLSDSILRLFDTNFGTYGFRDLGMYKNISHRLLKPFIDQLCDIFILVVFYGLSLLGIFFLLSEKIRDKKIILFLVSSAISFCIGVIGYFLFLGIEPDRWILYIQLFFSVFAALGLYMLFMNIKNEKMKYFAILIIIFSFSFFSIIISSIDNPAFHSTTDIRYTFTNSELSAINTLNLYWDGYYVSDNYYSILYRFNTEKYTPNTLISIDNDIFFKKFDETSQNLILLRDYIIHYPFQSGFGIDKINYDPKNEYEIHHFSKIFDSKSVSGYISL